MLSQAVTLVLHFFGIGKKRPSKIMMIFLAELQGLADIGKEHLLSFTAWLARVSFVDYCIVAVDFVT